MSTPGSAQTYQLIIHVENEITITVGRLGRFRFPAGYYIYTGSARRGMKNRLARHQRRDKKLFWHIDYLLNHSNVNIIGIRTFVEPECVMNHRLDGVIIAPGFGASDCRAKCKSHLKYISNQLSAIDVDFDMMNC